MCGRYVLRGDWPELFEGEFSDTRINIQLPITPTWNASPSQTLPVVVEEDDGLVVRGMRWGLIPPWTKPGETPKLTPINARSETAAEKSMFKSSLKYRRCIVPASGFYEWKRLDPKTKIPHYIHLKDGQMMLFAGLWAQAKTDDGPLQSYTIMTTAANEQMESLHDRMPVILSPKDAAEWLDHDIVETAPVERLLRPLTEGALDIYEVDRKVNSPKNNDPSNIEPA
jgi:putative SOS response-associated peptidase YedK